MPFDKLPTPDFRQWKITKPEVAVVSGNLSPVNLLIAPDDRWSRLRTRIDEAKNKLNSVDQASSILLCLDMFADMRQRLEDKYNMVNATNATIKMYELLHHMQLLIGTNGICLPTVNVFCNAELPGGFIIAINHFVKTQCSPETPFHWVGNSLWPAKGQTQLDDDLDLYKRNEKNWVMGNPPLSNGDVTDPSTLQTMKDKTEEIFEGAETLLYTSDIGAGFPDKEDKSLKNREEELEAILNFGQIVAGLVTLGKGGHLVTKQFTFTTPFSRSLIVLVASLFAETYITKPQTSRVNNSEVYLVAKGFEGIEEDLLQALKERLEFFHQETPLKMARNAPHAAMYGSLLSSAAFKEEVDNSLFEAAEEVYNTQIEYLQEVLQANDYLKKNNITILANQKQAIIPQDKKDAAYKAWITENELRPLAAGLNLLMISKEERKIRQAKKYQKKTPTLPIGKAKIYKTLTLKTIPAPEIKRVSRESNPLFLNMFDYLEKLNTELETLKSEVIKTKLNFLYGFTNNENEVSDQFKVLHDRLLRVTEQQKKVKEEIKRIQDGEADSKSTSPGSTLLPLQLIPEDEEEAGSKEKVVPRGGASPSEITDNPEVLASASISKTSEAVTLRRGMYKYNAVEYIGYIGEEGFESGQYSIVNYDEYAMEKENELELLYKSSTRNINLLTDLMRLVQLPYTYSNSLMKKLV